MNETTVHALNAINLAFYRERADEFSATREFPWPGWRRLLRHLPEPRETGEPPLRVLDLGCGNGRFASFLCEALARRGARLDYCGLDASAPLLARARRRPLPGSPARFVELDFVDDPARLPPGPFDLAVLLGVLHGVPGRGRRRALVRAAAERLAPGGLLALTCWRFAELERFRRRLVSWETYNRGAAQPIDATQLDPGDHLMPWGRGPRPVRYCHATGADELDALVRGLGLECRETYLEDGRSGDLNRYAVFRAPRAGDAARRRPEPRR
jgi:SAM-dependent methyltransferase